ncbi:nuclear transport factor 2 family protein [Halalkalicoccus salilacus]|uniref:nuclear transport factor 2 family protein n=1 Tax=Halalkalicoccus salilacus TaxID=3117459 RepID=UPI00300E9AEC
MVARGEATNGMTTDENQSIFDRIDDALIALENRGAAAAASMYATDGVFIDPPYSTFEYQRRETIRETFDRVPTDVVNRLGFPVRDFVEEGDTYAVEVDTHHIAKDGSEREFPQAFVIEENDNGTKRRQTYLSFPPGWLRRTPRGTA